MPHKYHAQPTVVEGIRFASKLEARRYLELKLLERAGQIEGLELQPEFPLMTVLTTGTVHGAARAMAGAYPVIGKYVADFKYLRLTPPTGWTVEDAKGMDTPLGRWKRKHTELQYGIIVELYPPRARKDRRKATSKSPSRQKRSRT